VKFWKNLSVSLRMKGQNVDKVHIRHLMFEFRKGENITSATSAINSVYSSASVISVSVDLKN